MCEELLQAALLQEALLQVALPLHQPRLPRFVQLLPQQVLRFVVRRLRVQLRLRSELRLRSCRPLVRLRVRPASVEDVRHFGAAAGHTALTRLSLNRPAFVRRRAVLCLPGRSRAPAAEPPLATWGRWR
ncbi:MAG: hypothetical protein DWQ31_07145 [Planctomycetota bacterium]|nr:MAG: hypothetical protein DWQ31_07145 [Planctomycetota bacterium]REJ89569.1 MAG: hypothetical protein DWQ35_17940 [Planctomycetota bacterium]REK31432.1 MAG: hypothetical protein DWQ42_00450 [Planctomycetota bacterium]REK40662.1 MAG: hypothetical protein DWQ46_15590 [Planctomycetota bacterium]